MTKALAAKTSSPTRLRHIRTKIALHVSSALLVLPAATPAFADCSSTTPADNATVVCSGDGTVGVIADGSSDVAVTVLPDATLLPAAGNAISLGSGAGINLGAGSTVGNETLEGTYAVRVGSGSTVTVNGTIQGRGGVTGSTGDSAGFSGSSIIVNAGGLITTHSTLSYNGALNGRAGGNTYQIDGTVSSTSAAQGILLGSNDALQLGATGKVISTSGGSANPIYGFGMDGVTIGTAPGSLIELHGLGEGISTGSGADITLGGLIRSYGDAVDPGYYAGGTAVAVKSGSTVRLSPGGQIVTGNTAGLGNEGSGAIGIQTFDYGAPTKSTVIVDGTIDTQDAHGIFGGLDTISVGPTGRITTRSTSGFYTGIFLDPFETAADHTLSVDIAGTVEQLGMGNALLIQGDTAFTESGETSIVANINILEGGALVSQNDAAYAEYDGAGPYPEIITDFTVAGRVARGTPGTVIDLNDGADRITFLPTYQLTGDVDGGSDAGSPDQVEVDTFALDGAAGTSGTFDFTANRVLNFEAGEKNGMGTWTVGGPWALSSPTPGTPGTVAVNQGTLIVNGAVTNADAHVASGASLGGAGSFDGTVSVADGGVLLGTTGTTFGAGALALGDASAIDVALGAPSAPLFDVAGNLTLDGTLNVSALSGFGNGLYTIFQYGTLAADNTLELGARPPDYTYALDVGSGTASAVTLLVGGGEAGDVQFWDGSNTTPGLTPNGRGGTGTWDGTTTNWTNQAGTGNWDWGGNFAIFAGAAGTVSVAGSQAFTGMQFLAPGYVIAAGTGGELAASLADTRISIGSGAATIAAPITGTGGIVKQEAGTLVVSGSNTYSDTTLVQGGALQAGAVNAFSATSAHIVASGATLDLAGNDQAIGSLAGAGRVALGTATLATGGDDTSTVFGGVIEGFGGLTKTGSGTLTLAAGNTYTGTTFVTQGTLSLGDGGTGGSVAGDIVNDGTLAFNRSDDVVYTGALSGTGATRFLGPGMTTLEGSSGALAGPVFVTAGNLRIASGASIGATALTVEPGGILSGLGSVNGNLDVKGRLAPGDVTLGALAVAGDAAFENGSTYAIRIAGTNPDPAPLATVDSLNVGGHADLTGGSVEISAIDPRTSYVDGHTYATPIVSAAAGLGGTEFSSVGMASGSAFITPALSYTGNDAFLSIAVTQDFATAAATRNQFQAAGALNNLGQSGDALAVFNTIADMNASDARQTFDQSSGEIHATSHHVVDQAASLFNRTLRQQGMAGIGAGNVGARLVAAPLAMGPRLASSDAGTGLLASGTALPGLHERSAWAAPLGSFGHVDGDGNAAKLDWWNAGLAGGYQSAIDVTSGQAVGGVGLGYIHARGTVDDRMSHFDSDGFYVGAYGAWANGAWNLAGSLSYGANRVSTQRNIAFMSRTAKASYWTHTVEFSGETSYGLDLSDTTRLAPLFTVDAGWSRHGGFTETGAGALDLSSGSESWNRFDTGLGFMLTRTVPTSRGRLTLEGRITWEHAFADVVPSESLTLAGSPTRFTVQGPDAGRDRLRVGAGLALDVSDRMTLRARYDGLLSGNQASHAASVGLSIKF